MFVFDNQCLNTAKLVCEDIEWIQECNFPFNSSSSKFVIVGCQCSPSVHWPCCVPLCFPVFPFSCTLCSLCSPVAFSCCVPLLLHIDPVDWKPPMSLMGKERNYPHSTFYILKAKRSADCALQPKNKSTEKAHKRQKCVHYPNPENF